MRDGPAVRKYRRGATLRMTSTNCPNMTGVHRQGTVWGSWFAAIGAVQDTIGRQHLACTCLARWQCLLEHANDSPAPIPNLRTSNSACESVRRSAALGAPIRGPALPRRRARCSAPRPSPLACSPIISHTRRLKSGSITASLRKARTSGRSRGGRRRSAGHGDRQTRSRRAG